MNKSKPVGILKKGRTLSGPKSEQVVELLFDQTWPPLASTNRVQATTFCSMHAKEHKQE